MRSEVRNKTRLEALLSETVEAAIVREQSALDDLLVAHRRRVILFGAGTTGSRAQRCLRSIGVEPLAIVDNNQKLHGSQIDGISIMAPEQAANLYGEDALFVIAIWNARHWYGESAAQLAALGCRNVAPIGPLLWRFHDTFLPFFVQDLPHKVFAEKQDVLRASALWSDEQSHAEYIAHVRWRTHGEVASLSPRTTQESYFADDLFDLDRDEALVDCGAYDGDTIRSFLSRRGSDFKSIDAIEPAPGAYAKLSELVSTLSPGVQKKIRMHPCALGAKPGSVRFDASRGVDSQISNDGEVTVDLRTLDAICYGRHPTYLKMDIEGAEFDALSGAKEVIVRERPVLAVCLEHYQNDLWKLPLLIHDTLPEYSMYLRTYEGDGWQSVCYAVPPNRRRKSNGE